MTRAMGLVAAVVAVIAVVPAAAHGRAAGSARCTPHAGERVVVRNQHVVVLGRPDRGAPHGTEPVRGAWELLVGCRLDTGRRRTLVEVSYSAADGWYPVGRVVLGGWRAAWILSDAGRFGSAVEISVVDVRTGPGHLPGGVVGSYLNSYFGDTVDDVTVTNLQGNAGGTFAWRVGRPLTDTIETWDPVGGRRVVGSARQVRGLRVTTRAVHWTAAGARQVALLSTPDACPTADVPGGGPGIDLTDASICDRATGRVTWFERGGYLLQYAGPFVLTSRFRAVGPSLRVDVRDGSVVALPEDWTAVASTGAVARISACGVQIIDGDGLHQYSTPGRGLPFDLAADGSMIIIRSADDAVIGFETHAGPLSPEAVAQAGQCVDPRLHTGAVPVTAAPGKQG
jgi:hypothetical protein